MKKTIIASLLAVFLFSCNTKLKEENEQLQKSNSELIEQLNTKEGTLNDFLGSLNEIEANLSIIKDKEKMISRAQLEGRPNRMDVIQQDIKAIDGLLEKNRQLIARLNRDLRNSNLKISEFDEMVKRLNQQVEEKEHEIVSLRAQLQTKTTQVSTLTAKVEDLEDFKGFLEEEARQRDVLIEQKTRELNTVYYTMGTLKELRDMGVVSRSGGFLGIGRSTNLEANFDSSNFTRIDKIGTQIIPLTGKRFELVSKHPSGTSQFVEEEGVWNLVINDRERFWSTSKFLVILIR